MAIDFSGLVLAPAMGTFANPVTVNPLVSQPTVAPYLSRGVWKVDNVDIVLEDGGRFSNRTIKLGIRLAEFVVAPKQGDWISTAVVLLPLGYWQGDIDPNSIIDFIVDDQSPDGQGGAVLVLKRIGT